jgi:hypothetical protein
MAEWRVASLPRSADQDFDSYVDCSTTITTAVHLRGYVCTYPKVMGVLSIFRTSTDIFPSINIPVVSIISSFNAMVPKDMSDRSSALPNETSSPS